MISSSYVKFAACAVLGSLVALGCTITTGDGDFDGFGGADSAGGSNSSGGKATGGTGGKPTGGAGGTGGASSGGTSSGGAAAGGSNTSGGAASGGGSTGGNGSGGAADAVMCNDAGTLMPTTVLVTCAADSPDMACQTCIASKCCTEFEKCRGGSPRTACGYGGPNGIGEAKAVQACIQDAGATDSVTITECENMAKTAACAVPDPNTDKLIQCLKTNCPAECLSPP